MADNYPEIVINIVAGRRYRKAVISAPSGAKRRGEVKEGKRDADISQEDEVLEHNYDIRMVDGKFVLRDQIHPSLFPFIV